MNKEETDRNVLLVCYGLGFISLTSFLFGISLESSDLVFLGFGSLSILIIVYLFSIRRVLDGYGCAILNLKEEQKE